MLKNFLITLILILFVSVGYGQIIDTKAVDILNAVSKKTKSYESIKIDFSYKMENKSENINENLKGTVIIKGDKYRLEFMGQVVISDGKTAWSYNEEANEVQISNVDPDDEQSNPAKILTSYDKNFKAKFIKEAVENGRTVQTIDLVPIKGKSFYKMRLTIDKAKQQIISVIQFEKNNTIFTYTVKTLLTNVPVNDTMFTFSKSKYPGVEINDLR